MLDASVPCQPGIWVTNPTHNIACNTLTYVFAPLGLPALVQAFAAVRCCDSKPRDTGGEFSVGRLFTSSRGWRAYCHDRSYLLPVIWMTGGGGAGEFATGVPRDRFHTARLKAAPLKLCEWNLDPERAGLRTSSPESNSLQNACSVKTWPFCTASRSLGQQRCRAMVRRATSSRPMRNQAQDGLARHRATWRGAAALGRADRTPWAEMRRRFGQRRHAQTPRTRFRRNPDAHLATLEQQACQLTFNFAVLVFCRPNDRFFAPGCSNIGRDCWSTDSLRIASLDGRCARPG